MRNIIGNKPTQQTQVFGSWDEFVGYVEETPSDMEIEKRASYSAKEQRSREQHEIVKYWGGEYSMVGKKGPPRYSRPLMTSRYPPSGRCKKSPSARWGREPWTWAGTSKVIRNRGWSGKTLRPPTTR